MPDVVMRTNKKILLSFHSSNIKVCSLFVKYVSILLADMSMFLTGFGLQTPSHMNVLLARLGIRSVDLLSWKLPSHSLFNQIANVWLSKPR